MLRVIVVLDGGVGSPDPIVWGGLDATSDLQREAWSDLAN
jgi:hypothetical protein